MFNSCKRKGNLGAAKYLQRERPSWQHLGNEEKYKIQKIQNIGTAIEMEREFLSSNISFTYICRNPWRVKLLLVIKMVDKTDKTDKKDENNIL